MKVTYPHMGNMCICVKAMLEYLDVDVVLPPPMSKKTMNLGTKYGSEFACLPLKLNLGNLIEAYEMGADTVLMAGGCGPCRFGYYAQVEHAILKDLGCNYDLVVLEPPEKHFGEFTARLRRITGNKSWLKVLQAIRYGYNKSKILDEIESLSFKIRPRELRVGESDLALKVATKGIMQANNMQELRLALLRGKEIMHSVNIDKKRPVLKIALIGEIYTLLEPFANRNIERLLGRMGVEVERSMYLSEWVNDHLFMGILKNDRSINQYCDYAKPYLNHFVGGHGMETVGSFVYFARRGFQGAIQIFPFTCMPEIVAESILPKVAAEIKMPMMTLIFDEHSAEAGIITRLEAFVDLISRKQRTNAYGVKVNHG